MLIREFPPRVQSQESKQPPHGQIAIRDSSSAFSLQPKVLLPDLGTWGNTAGLLSSILVATDYGFLLTALDHTAIACNPKFGELFGLDPQKVVNNDMMEVRQMVKKRISDVASWEHNLDDIYARPELENLDELSLVNPPLTMRRWTGPIRNEANEIIGRLWTFLDISSEIKAKQIALSLSEVAATFSDNPAEVYTNLVGIVAKHYDSNSILSLLKPGKMEFRVVGGAESTVKEYKENLLENAYCKFCLKGGGPVIVSDARLDEETAGMMPAALGYVRYAGVPLHDPSGQIIGTLCILDSKSDEPLDATDINFLQLVASRISSELEREIQLAALKDDLSARDTLLKRTEHRLIQSEKLAVTGMLSASIAHDIRNILSAISLELTLEQDPNEAIIMVERHLERFRVLSHRLLSYASPSDVATELISVPKVLNLVAQLLAGHLHVSNMGIETHFEEANSPIHADPMRLEHLFVNLSLNAIQAMSAGGRLTYRVYEEAQWVTVEIEDTGKGIPASKLANLFEPFRSGRVEGFGLGLYSCQQIVQEAQGTIQVQSEMGRGTTFILRFPKA